MSSKYYRFNGFALAALLAIGISTPQAKAQSWVPVSGSPTFISGYTCQVDGIVSPAPNVMWAVHTTYDIGFWRTQISQTTNNGQTMQTTVASYATSNRSTPLVGTFIDDYSILDANTAWVLRRDNTAVFAGPPGGNQISIIQHTTSGVTGFSTMPGVLPAPFYKFHFFTATSGVALSAANGVNSTWQIYRTTDGGATWTAVQLSVTVPVANGYISKESKGNSLWISFSDGSVLYTLDGGLTWGTSSTGLPGAQLVFRDNLHGLAYSRRQLARTMDSGQSWALLSVPWPTDVKSIIAQPGATTNASTSYIGAGYAQGTTSAGFNGVVATSSDDGATWQTQLANNFTYRHLAANEAGQLWAALEEPYRGSLAGSAMLLRDARGPLAIRTASAENISVYPNPTTGVFQLAGPIQGKETVHVYDGAGRLCQQGMVWDAHRTIDLSTQPVGVYQVQVMAADGTIRNQRLNKTQ